MRTLQLPICGLLASLCLAVGVHAETAQEVLTQAQAAYLRGDIDTAKKGFSQVVKADPRNQTAIGYLKMIAAQEAKAPVGNPLQKQLEKLIIPKVEFRDANLGSALDFLKTAATKNSDGKVAVNFVVQLPDELVKTTVVTLSLANIPYSEALRYLGSVANIDFAYEKYAIVVKPRGTASAAPAVAAPPAGQ